MHFSGTVWCGFRAMVEVEEAVDRVWTGRVGGGDEAIGCLGVNRGRVRVPDAWGAVPRLREWKQ